jgi:hypothetical protein
MVFNCESENFNIQSGQKRKIAYISKRMKQAKCPTCNEWSKNTEICDQCGSAISREKQELEYRKKNNIVSKPEPPGALQRFFEYGQKSNNPFVKLLYYIVLSIWGVYVGIIVIMLYIAAAAAG